MKTIQDAVGFFKEFETEGVVRQRETLQGFQKLLQSEPADNVDLDESIRKTLVAATRSGVSLIQIQAGRTLAQAAIRFRDPDLVKPVVSLLNDEDPNVRRAIVRLNTIVSVDQFSDTASELFKPSLRKLLSDEDVRFDAAAFLLDLGDDGESTAKALIDAAVSGETSSDSLARLGRMKSHRTKAVGWLVDSLKTKESSNNAVHAIKALGILIPESEIAFETLSKFANSKSSRVRRAVIETVSLFTIEHAKIAKLLIAATYDDSTLVRAEAILKLPRVSKNPMLLREVCARLMQNGNLRIKRNAAEALMTLGEDVELAIPPLSRMLMSPDAADVKIALNSVAQMNDSQWAFDTLLGITRSSRLGEKNRLQAFAFLTAMDLPEEKKVHFLLKQLEDDSEQLKSESLRRLQFYKVESNRRTASLLVQALDDPRLAHFATALLGDFSYIESLDPLLKFDFRGNVSSRSQLEAPWAEHMLDDIGRAAVSIGRPAVEPLKVAAKNLIAEDGTEKDLRPAARASYALAKMGLLDEEVWPGVIKLFHSSDSELFWTAVRTFSLKKTPTESELKELLDVALTLVPIARQKLISSRQLRAWDPLSPPAVVLNIIGQMGERAQPLLPYIVKRIENESDRYQLMMEIGGSNEEAIAILKKNISYESLWYFLSLGPAAKSALPELKELLNKQDEILANTNASESSNDAKAMRLLLLGVIGSCEDDSGPYVDQLKKELSGRYRRIALSALGSIAENDPAVLQLLIDRLPGTVARNVLLSLKAGSKCLPRLRELQNKEYDQQRERAIWFLAETPQEAINRLQDLLLLKKRPTAKMISLVIQIARFSDDPAAQAALKELAASPGASQYFQSHVYSALRNARFHAGESWLDFRARRTIHADGVGHRK